MIMLLDYMIFWKGSSTRYPDLLIEGCSGGGGRFDAGMMYYTPQIWCSDNTDALIDSRSNMVLHSVIRYPL